MAALTTILSVAAVGVGVAGAVAADKDRKRIAQETQARAEQKKLEAREAGRLKGNKASEARVKVGSNEKDAARIAQQGKGGATRRTDNGVGGFGVSAAKIGGL